MAWLIQATFMATFSITEWSYSCGQQGEGTTLSPQSPRPRNVTALKAPRAPGQIGLGERSGRDQREGQPLPQAPLGSPSSRASPASSPAACGGGRGGGRGAPNLSCPAFWPGLGFLLPLRRLATPEPVPTWEITCTNALSMAKSESSDHHWGNNRCSRPAFNDNQFSLWLFAK